MISANRRGHGDSVLDEVVLAHRIGASRTTVLWIWAVGTVKLTNFLEAPLIDMPPKSLICRAGSNRFRVEKEWIQVNLTVSGAGFPPTPSNTVIGKGSDIEWLPLEEQQYGRQPQNESLEHSTWLWDSFGQHGTKRTQTRYGQVQPGG